jgi:hypothetical protein
VINIRRISSKQLLDRHDIVPAASPRQAVKRPQCGATAAASMQDRVGRAACVSMPSAARCAGADRHRDDDLPPFFYGSRSVGCAIIPARRRRRQIETEGSASWPGHGIECWGLPAKIVHAND